VLLRILCLCCAAFLYWVIGELPPAHKEAESVLAVGVIALLVVSVVPTPLSPSRKGIERGRTRVRS
jgi:hypothetical protein